MVILIRSLNSKWIQSFRQRGDKAHYNKYTQTFFNIPSIPQSSGSHHLADWPQQHVSETCSVPRLKKPSLFPWAEQRGRGERELETWRMAQPNGIGQLSWVCRIPKVRFDGWSHQAPGIVQLTSSPHLQISKAHSSTAETSTTDLLHHPGVPTTLRQPVPSCPL